MAIRDGVDGDGSASGEQPLGPASLPAKLPRPGLVVNEVLQSCAITAATECAIFPREVAQARIGSRLDSADCRRLQLVSSTETALIAYAVDSDTRSLVELDRMRVHERVLSVSAMRAETPNVDLLIVLTRESKVSFVRYDTRLDSMICAGSVFVHGRPIPPATQTPRRYARLVAVHPRRRIVAVATLESTLSVFPVLFLPDGVSPGKVVSLPVQGTILSLDFLEDTDLSERGRSFIVALVQKEGQQHVALFCAHPFQISSGGSLSLSWVSSISTCAARSDDLAIARRQAKLTGEPMRPPPRALFVAGLRDCPYVMAVFMRGRVSVANVSGVLRHLYEEDSDRRRSQGATRPPTPVRSRLRALSPHGNMDAPLPAVSPMHETRDDDARTMGSMSTEDLLSHHEAEARSLASHAVAPSSSASGDASRSPELETATHAHAAGDANVVDTRTSGGASTPNFLFGQSTQAISGSSHMELRASGNWTALESRLSMSRIDMEGSGGSSHHEGIDRFLGFPLIPPHVVLEYNGEQHGSPTSRCLALGHARLLEDLRGGFKPNQTDRLARAMNPREDAIYFTTETGVMYMLHWCSGTRTDGIASLVIPEEQPRADVTPLRDKTGQADSFSLEPAGLVGPASSLVALASGLVFIANDGADGTLREIGLREPAPGAATVPRILSSHGSTRAPRFELLVRQEFLNLSPISDFVLHDIRTSPLEQLQSEAGDVRKSTSGLRGSARGGDPARARNIAVQRQRFLDNRTSALKSPPGSSAGDPYSRRTTKRGRTTGLPGASTQENASPASPVRAKDDARRHHLHRMSSEALDTRLCTVAGTTDGVSAEDEALICSGIGPSGTTRIVRSGGFVSVLSRSAEVFPGCNNMWSVRATRASRHDAFLVLSFAESTGVLLPSPPTTSGMVGRLLDGSHISGFRLNSRTIACGGIRDGAIAQVFREGVRLVVLAQSAQLRFSEGVETTPVEGSLVDTVYEWEAPPGSFISAGCVGPRHVVVSIVQPGHGTRLALIGESEKIVNGSPTSNGLRAISFVALSHEVSCMQILPYDPNDVTQLGASQDRCNVTEPLLFLGTYAPSLQARRLVSGLPLMDELDLEGRFEAGELPHTASEPKDFGTEPHFRNELIGGVSESICPISVRGRAHIFVGARNGCVAQFRMCQPTSTDASLCLQMVSRRRLGVRPVRLALVRVAMGHALLAQCEGTWLLPASTGLRDWTRLRFRETLAACALSMPGAERCVAITGTDNALHLCAIRHNLPVSISTIRVHATPRRIVSVPDGHQRFVVATSPSNSVTRRRRAPETDIREQMRKRLALAMEPQDEGVLGPAGSLGATPLSGLPHEGHGDSGSSIPVADLRLFDRASQTELARLQLLHTELAHVLLTWRDFIVVGTSFDLRTSHAQGVPACPRGRLLLYSIDSLNRSSDSSAPFAKDSVTDAHLRSRVAHRVGQESPRKSKGPTRVHPPDFEICSEVILPGAILAGAVSQNQRILVVSSNEHIFAFALSQSRSALVEIARTFVRMMVVSISIHNTTICVADAQDSLAFYSLDITRHTLTRERGDFWKRRISCATLVDAKTAIACGASGCLFSLAYDEEDVPFEQLFSKTTESAVGPHAADQELNAIMDDDTGENSDALEHEADGIENASEGSWNEDADMDSEMAGFSLDVEPGGSSAGPSGSHPAGGSVDMYGGDDGSPADHEPQENPSVTDGLSGGPSAGWESSSEALQVSLTDASGSEAEAPAVASSGVQTSSHGSAPEPHAEPMENALAGNAGQAPTVSPAASEGPAGQAVDGLQSIEETGDAANAIADETGGSGNENAGGVALPGDAAAEAGGEGEGNEMDENGEVQAPPREPAVQRNLVCHHAYNLNDVILRLRAGTFRSNSELTGFEAQPGPRATPFWSRHTRRVVGCSLSGAMLVVAPVSPVEMATLTTASAKIAELVEASRLVLGDSHSKFRQAFHDTARGVLDAGLLKLYYKLDMGDQACVAASVGLHTRDGIHTLADIITRVCERAS